MVTSLFMKERNSCFWVFWNGLSAMWIIQGDWLKMLRRKS